jgi:hypothetical protein
MILIATRSLAREPNFDAPDAIFWSDGRPGSSQDYHSHLDDTHALVHCANGSLERRMYPWIVADVRYDGYMRLWFVVAPGQDRSLWIYATYMRPTRRLPRHSTSFLWSTSRGSGASPIGHGRMGIYFFFSRNPSPGRY